VANWFVAFEVPGEDVWFARRVPPPPPTVRLFHPGDLHATIAFLGAVDEGAARGAFEVAAAGPLPAPFRAGLGAVVPMGPPRRWSALSAEVAGGASTMGDVITRLRGPTLAAAGARPDDRPPRPHVTIARLARRSSAAERNAAQRWAAGIALEDVDVPIEAIALYTWSEDRRERLFQTMARCPLPGPGR